MAGSDVFDVDDPISPQLLRSASLGDGVAFRQLFDALWGAVYSAALRLTKSPEMAQDLAQEVFIKLWDNRAALGGINNIRAYLYTITRNLTHDHLRKQVLRESNRDFLSTYFSLNTSTPQQLLENKELGHKLNAAIQKLPEYQRNVFNMSYIEGLSHKEIAQKLGITPLTSRVYLVRAINLLRKDMSGSVPGMTSKDFLILLPVCLHFFSKQG